MSNIIWQIVSSNDIVTLLMRGFDGRQEVANTTKKHQFFLFHLSIVNGSENL